MTTARRCSVAAALGVIGEKYSLLVLREVFFRVRRFDAIQRNTGAPRDVLTTRLRRLVDAGVLEKVRYQERPERYEYHLTPAGVELRPVLLVLMQWGDRHLVAGPPVVLEHSCGADLDATLICRDCGAEVRNRDITPRFSPDDPELVAARGGRPAVVAGPRR
jgi:DNA-binding HxlR family transcriptional regulator